MTVTIIRLFNDYAVASQVVRDLEAAGLRHSDLSIVASNSGDWFSKTTKKTVVDSKYDHNRDGVDDRAQGAEMGAGLGAVAGGAVGLLAGIGLIAIPGLGPVVAAGWLAATAAGAAAVGVAGGIIGALTEAGVSEEHAAIYAESVRRGGAIVTARVPDHELSRYEMILDGTAVNIEERQLAYHQSGWKGFDDAAPPHI